MRIMGVSGLAGSGKSFVSELAAERGAMIISMGDIIREEAKKRGESTGETAENLRKEYGQYIVAELTVKKIKKLLDEGFDSSIVVEGIRSPHEVTLFKESFSDFIILSIFANQEIRFERIKARKREDDATNFDEFKIREDRELNFGIGDVVSLSDKIIINESDLDSYLVEIEKFLEEYNI